MPPALPLLVSAALTAAKVGAVATLIASTATSLAVGMYSANKANRKARRAYNDSLQDRHVNVKSGVAARNLVLGTVRVGGAWMYAETLGAENEALDTIIAFAGNECELVGWYLNDEYVPAAEWPGTKFGQRERQWFRGMNPLLPAGPASIPLEHVPDGDPVVYASMPNPSGDISSIQVLLPSSVGGGNLLFTVPAGHQMIEWTYWHFGSEKLLRQWHSGTASQTPTNWSAFASPKWTAAHRLRGVAHARVLNVWDENLFADGPPEVGVVLTGRAVDGHPFVDPRGGSPTATRNPAILAAWYMTLPRARGGCGIPSSWIDWTSVAASANVCDELIWAKGLGDGPWELIPRYQCDTILPGDNPPMENLQMILSAMGGRHAFTNGAYRVEAGAFRVASVTLTDDDIIGSSALSMSAYNADEPPPNMVTASFADARQHWIETSAPAVINAAYVAADGAERPLDLGALPAITDPRRANYLQGVELETRRPAFQGTVTVGTVGEQLRLLDTVTMDVTNRSAYSGKTFEVVRKVDHWDGTFELTLSEIRPNTWALDADRYTPIEPVGVTDASYLWLVTPVTGLTVEMTPAQILGDGTGPGHVVLRWDLHAQASVRQGGRIELRYRQIGTAEWTGIPEVDGSETSARLVASMVDSGSYEFQARARNGVGAVSSWVNAIESATGEVFEAVGGIRIQASSLAFRIDIYGGGSPSLIELEAILTPPLTGPVTWEVVGAGAAVVTPTGDTTATLAPGDMAGDAASIKAKVSVGAVEYSDIVTVLKIHDGLTGERGATGVAGSLTGYGSSYGMTPSAWSSQLANRVIYNMLTGQTSSAGLAETSFLLIGDTVTLSNGEDWSQTRFWDGAGSWLEPGMVIDGNLIVHGTASASILTAGEIRTGDVGNARIKIGSNSFIGSSGGTLFSSPLHVEKAATKANQVLISALNDKDSSVPIWGASAHADGNAISGTWHATSADAQFSRWQMIGVLGGALSQFGAAVAGSVYGQKQAGAFRYYSGASSATPGGQVVALGICDATRAAWAAGAVELTGSGSPLRLNGSDGTAGQVLTSNGPGATPSWGAGGGGGGSVTYASVQTAFAGSTGSALNLTTTFRSTGTNAPTSGSGTEVAYLSGEGFLIACTRASNGSVSSYRPLQLQGSSITANVAPAHPTPSTATNNTTSATTAYVVNRIAQDAPTKTGSGASGTWPISVSGNAATASNATRVLNQKCFGGQGVTNGVGNLVVNFPEAFASENSFGVSAVSTDGYYVIVAALSASSVTLQVQNRATGTAVASAACRWTAVGS